MAKFKRAMIVEQSREYVVQIREMLKDYCRDFAFTTDGAEAMQLYQKYQPDLLLVEAIMPGYDGFALLEQITKDDIVKIVLTSMNHELIIRKAFDVGADYVLVKPYAQEVFVSRVLEVVQFREANRVERVEVDHFTKTRIALLLKRLGVPASIKGYRMICDALLLLYKEPTRLRPIRDNIYEPLAEQYSTTPQCVERNIRHAIETAVLRGDADAFAEVFGYSMDSYKGKPTNREFLAALQLQLKEGE